MSFNLDFEMAENSSYARKDRDVGLHNNKFAMQTESETTVHSQFSSKAVNTQTAIELPADVDVKSDVLDILMEHNQQIQTSVRQTMRQKVHIMLHSTKFMISVIVLIILDICLILTELFLELVLLKKGLDVPENLEMLFLILSTMILSVFLIELALRIYALGLAFFMNVLEVFDGTIIIVSFVIDTFELTRSDFDLIAADLIILFRLWRVTRLFTGFISSLKMQAAIKSTEEKRFKKEMSEKITQCEMRCLELQKNVDYLSDILRQAKVIFEPYQPNSTDNQ